MVCALRSFELGKRVARHLEHRGVEHLLPSYQCTSRRKDRHVDLERALFPGYLFIKLPFCERLKVLTVPNVLSIVGTRTCPSVVSDDEISWIKSGVEHGGLKPHSYLDVGTRVVVMSGVAAGMEGILLRKHNNVRILVALDSIAQAFVIENRWGIGEAGGWEACLCGICFSDPGAPRRRINSSDDDPAVHRTS